MFVLKSCVSGCLTVQETGFILSAIESHFFPTAVRSRKLVRMDKGMERLKQLAGPDLLPQCKVSPPPAGSENAASRPTESEEQDDKNSTSLECLEREFSDYLRSLPDLTQEQKQKVWNGLISLFLKIFDHNSSNWIMRFPSILPFSIEASKIMVQAIKQKLDGKVGDEARSIVEEFLQWNQDVGSSEGWQLLKTIHLLTVADSETLRCIVKTGLNLILLKCLHLFTFSSKRGSGTMESQTQDSSTIFQETITHIMLHLCSQVSAVEAMVQTNDLRCLILAVASQWDQCNSSWRTYTGHVLKAISKTPTKNIVRYLHDSECIKKCIQNLSAMADKSSVYEAAQAAVHVLCFVKDSYQVSPDLFADFESADGYQLLTNLLLGCDKELEKQEEKSMEELVDFLSSLTIYGQKQLKVTPCIAGSQFPNFKFQQLSESDTTVKNVQAFKVLQFVFLKTTSSCISSMILSSIKKIWSWDRANFFLLEWTQQTLFQFAEVIYLKSRPVQIQYFQMLRCVVIDMSYIPHEVFSRVQAIIRENLSPACALLALECVLDIAKHDPLLTIVFRETRLLEMLLTQLQRSGKMLRKAGNKAPSSEQQHQREVSCLMLQVVAVLLQGSVKNIVILREYGMVPYIKIFLDDQFYRSHALSILEQLFIMNAEEYMRVVIGVLCSATQTELVLKLDLLQSLLKVLGVPKARTAFRTAGGFNALQSVLADMEGALCDPPSGNWAMVDQSDIWDLIQTTLCTLTVAMHSDPVNSHFFRTQGHFDKMMEDLRLFGCFSSEGGRLECPLDVDTCRKFEKFLSLARDSTEAMRPPLRKCVKLFDFLDRMAKGTLSSPCPTQQIREDLATSHSEPYDEYGGAPQITGSHQDTSDPIAEPSEQQLKIDLEDRFAVDSALVHPGAICVMMDLLPNVSCEGIPQLSLQLQYAVADYILSLVKSERNRQVMCGSGLLTVLINRYKEPLADNNNVLHLPLIRTFEKLACQAVEPRVLRQFLCLGEPLNCTVGKKQMCDSSGKHQTDLSWCHVGSNEADWGRRGTVSRRGSLIAKHRPMRSFSLSHVSSQKAIPRHRVMSLVSMMSSRQFHPTKSSTAPSFTEFDMSVVGYGCCFLPTLATVSGVNAESPIAGGIGDGCRGFPPPVGFTYSTWFTVISFSSAFDAHPIRFLTVFRHTSKMEKDFVCLSINISAPEKQLVISTQEEVFEPFDWNEPSQNQQPSALTSVKFNISKYLTCDQWQHLAVVLNKDPRRNTTVLAYLNGKAIGTAKIQYIQTFPGMHFSSDSSAVIDVHGIIGTPQIWKQRSSLVWRLGPTFLFEEVIPEQNVNIIYQLGPNYLGNFQSVYLPGNDLTKMSEPSVLVAEEKVSFGINVVSSVVMTVTDIRTNYNEVDSRLISSELGISSRDDAMPIVLAKNMASHLPGLARTIGAPIASFFGVRTFFSNPAANCLQFIGGPAVILGLVAMASDDHEIYAAVKVLISVLNSSTLCEKEMGRIKGYRILALLLKLKVKLLNARIFQLILTIVGTAELGQGTSTIHNGCAFSDLLCDFEIWRNSPDSLDLLLFNHFLELLKSSDRRHNAEVMHRLQLIPRLVFLLNDPNNTRSKVHVICTILAELLKSYFTTADLLRIGLFLTYTLPPASMNEKLISLERVSDTSIDVIHHVPGRTIWLRNQLLRTLLDVCWGHLKQNSKDQEKMFNSLGPDWFLLFMQAHLHPTTVILSTRLLLHFLYNPALLVKFRDGMRANAWLENSTAGCSILVDNIKTRPQTCSQMPYLVPGFEIMQMFLSHHASIPELYLLLAALVLQKPLEEMPEDSKMDLDMMITWLLEQVKSNQSDKSVKIPNGLCTEAAMVLLDLVRATLSKPISVDTDDSWEVTYPGNVMHFFCLVYYMIPDEPLWRSPEFLHSLAAAGFPMAGPPCYTPDGGIMPQESLTSTPGPQPQLSMHPARKQVSDFIRILLLYSFMNIPANKQLHPIEILVEVSPERATGEQKKSFQTEILLFVMDIFHIISEEQTVMKVLVREGQRATCKATEGNLAMMFENITYFSQTFVDKLYARMFDVNPEKILRFLTEQICTVMEQAYSQKDQVMSNLYTSLNRAILYCLSRPRQSPSDLLILLNTLRFLQEQWDIIFATYNSSLSFTICLIHCLCQIKAGSYPDGFGVGTSNKKASWILQSASNSEDYDGSFEAMHAEEAQKELMDSVDWVWNHLMLQRRQFLEDIYKIDLSVKQKSNETVVDFSEVSPLWEESATKAWHQYIASERKNLSSKGVLSQLQHSKSEWLPESLSTAMRSVSKRILKEADRLTMKDFTTAMDMQRKTGQELFATLHKENCQMQQCILNQTSKDWAKMEQQLLRERGLWGPSSGSQQGAWILDMAEGPCRMRKKMRRNTICINYAYNAYREKEAKSESGKSLALSFGNKEFYMKLCSTDKHVENTDKQTYPGLLLNLAEDNVDERGMDCNQLTFFPALIESIQSEEFFEDCVERHAILQALDAKEKINTKYSLIVADNHLLMEGVLLFGISHFYVCENFTLSASDDVYCVHHHPSSINDSYIYDLCNKETSGKHPKCSRYSYNEVREIHHLRFLLQDIGLEIFLKNGFSKLLVFHKNDRKKIFKKFCHAIPSVKKSKKDGLKNVGKTMGEKAVTQKWQKREISNFEYLMHLNTLAGRTYNDLMQYPVFPWILADYDSEELDLTNAKTFRDLSKPMGAQTEDRKEKFVQRYFEVENDGDLTARCHYCTHYSSAIIVASYLVRMEPFTQTFCSLQGGCFDVADRMFFSIKKEWESSSRDNMSDVRELIPEFFYLPDFLLNHNGLEFGSMQDGTTLGDVILPPWAKGDAREFIRQHRMALESDYVSAHLHHWIDLIFGYKQQGSAAVEAINVFHPYFYDDQIDLRSIKDPLKKITVMGFVSNFGQIPKQLFTKAHPARNAQGKHTSGKESAASSPAALPFFYHSQNLKSSSVKELLKGAVGHIVHTEKGVLAVEKNKLLIPPDWSRMFCWGYDDFSCSLGNYGAEKSLTVFECLSDWGQCMCAVSPNATTVITGGTSSVVCVWEISANKDKAKSMTFKEVLRGHIEAVTCLAVSLTYNVIVSGSRDRTCIIWDFNTLTYVNQLQQHEATVSAVSINDLTGDIATCAGTFLYLWTINGQPIVSVNTASDPTEEILCCCFTEAHEWDLHNVVVTGCANGIVRLWKTEFQRLQVTKNDGDRAAEKNGYKWERHLILCRELSRSSTSTGKQNKRSPAVTALGISRNQAKLFVGDAWGRVYSWSVEG